jgi:hypothetical protein
MKAFVRTAIIIGAGLWGTAALAGDFNGRWTVRLVTDSGVCDQSYNTVLSVQNGHVSGGGASVSGAVSSGARSASESVRGSPAARQAVSCAATRGRARGRRLECAAAAGRPARAA